MSSDIEKTASETVDKHVAGTGAAAAASKSKLPMLIGLLVLGVAAVYGGRMLLEAQVPKGENEFVRQETEIPEGMKMDPKAGSKPPSASAPSATEEAKDEE